MIDIAHIHPMLVHFPIVLILFGVGLELLVMALGADPAEHRCLPNTALAALLLSALSAVVAAMFGDIALDKAASLGFPRTPMETHAAFGFTTMWFFIVLSAVYLFAWWQRYSLRGWKGWGLFVIGLVGVVLVLITAYHGGDLVYRIGVNVAPVKL